MLLELDSATSSIPIHSKPQASFRLKKSRFSSKICFTSRKHHSKPQSNFLTEFGLITIPV